MSLICWDMTCKKNGEIIFLIFLCAERMRLGSQYQVCDCGVLPVWVLPSKQQPRCPLLPPCLLCTKCRAEPKGRILSSPGRCSRGALPGASPFANHRRAAAFHTGGDEWQQGVERQTRDISEVLLPARGKIGSAKLW